MSDTMIVLLIIYISGTIGWLMITLIEWGVDREFPSLHTDEEIAAKARRVLQTPVWPLALMGIVGRVIANLQKDVMKP